MNRPLPSSAFHHLLEEDPEDLYESAPCAYLSTLPDGMIIKVNKTFLEWTGYTSEALVGRKRFQALLPVPGRVFYDTHLGPLLLMQGYARELAFELVCANGQRIPVLLNSVLRRDASGRPEVIRTTILNASGRRAYEEELRLAKRRAEEAEAAAKKLAEELESRVEQRTRERDRIWRISRDVLAVAALDGTLLAANPAFTRVLGWTEDEFPSLSLRSLAAPDLLPLLRKLLDRLGAGEPVDNVELLLQHRSSSYRWLSMAITPADQELYIVARDITEEHNQAESVRKMEDALRQAQKMESLGKLTGGVAHDFNNILQVVAGNLEMLKLEYAGTPQAGQRLQQARLAVDRGAKLASQLLSFARRQPLRPVPTNLGRVVREIDDLLRRALGDRIEIETIVGGGLWITSVDRNQFENVVLNLAINARDAMQGEGKLTLEIGNAMLDERYAQEHAGVMPGHYVMFSISDTGSGIPGDVLPRVFEPFFTTKATGEGTGLGLSMVHGFVKQSGGHIKVYSEAGVGTTFKIYLPRVQQMEIQEVDLRSRPIQRGSETVLVVEDDSAVQATAVDILSSLGYHVLRANDGVSALGILRSGLRIDLLFTDVVMPGPIQSTELATQAKAHLPAIAVLFTSGYTQDAIVHGGRLDQGIDLISKPYGREDLARKVRQVLDNVASQADAAAPALPPASTVAPAASGLRILVVEDNPDSLEMLCELLQMLGHTAKAASSAEEALSILADESFHLLLTDVSLPGKSGIELAREATRQDPSLRVVFSSGHGEVVETGIPALSLPKPFDLERLTTVLARSMDAMRG